MVRMLRSFSIGLLIFSLHSPESLLIAGSSGGPGPDEKRPVGIPTFTVNSEIDLPRTGRPGDGVCDNDPDTGPLTCTLHEAIVEAKSAGGGRILFSRSMTIRIREPLLVINHPIEIDAEGKEVRIDGSLMQVDPGFTRDGFVLFNHQGSVLRGLTIINMPENGVFIEEGGGHRIEGCYIGTDRSGTPNLGNNLNGIRISNSSNNRIGLPADLTPFGALPDPVIGRSRTCSEETSCNVVSGNQLAGITLQNGASDNLIYNSLVGLAPEGREALPNGGAGVEVLAGCHRNRIQESVISANLGDGIFFDSQTQDNSAENNLVGLDAAGMDPFGNQGFGIRSNTVSGKILRNVISGNGSSGIAIRPPGEMNLVADNYVGTDSAGLKAVPNQNHGISVGASDDNEMKRNLVSGNVGNGILLFAGAEENLIGIDDPSDPNQRDDGNQLGVSQDLQPLPNGGSGIFVFGASRNVVRGNFSGSNTEYGIRVQGDLPNNPAVENVLQGNSIGISFPDLVPLGNEMAGILLFLAEQTRR